MNKTDLLLNLNHSLAKKYLEKEKYPWDVLTKLKEIIIELGNGLDDSYSKLPGNIWIHSSASVAPTACICGPCIIGPETEIRHCAYLRENVIIGSKCVIGNSTEVKNAILFDMAQVPHFNYVGDSILGYKAHLGAGAILSNYKSDGSEICVHLKDETIKSGLTKLGAIIGESAEIGCNCVLNPGTVIGKNSTVYPLTSVRGEVEDNIIVKSSNTLVEKA